MSLDVNQHVDNHKISKNTDSSSNINLAKKWIKDCIEGHSVCQNSSNVRDTWHPSRLLNISIVGAGSKICLLVTDKQQSTYGPYMTLSHCWGSAEFPKLLKENLDVFHAGISILDLPKTFQDAIQITRALGVKYLWIDALCIIQDSLEDWRTEAAMMGSVYKHALCNIAATGAVDSSVGCFWNRNNLAVQPCKIELNWALPAKGAYCCFDRSFWPKNVGEAPLNRRAWVAQERLLSPRILHFGSHQLLWECQRMEACESFPNGIPRSRDPMSFIVRTGLKRLRASSNTLMKNASEENLPSMKLKAYEYWDGIVDLYTRCNLTRKEDKLIALSGVAKEIGMIIDDEYLAGLWKRFLPNQLLWFVSHPLSADGGQPSSRPSTYRAPSWSWASIDGCVVPGNVNGNDEWDLVPTFLHASVDLLGEDTTGQVTGGRIIAQGLLVSSSWQCVWIGRIYELFPNGKKADSNTFWPDDIANPPPDEVFCFPLLSQYWDTTRFLDGLVLACAENENEFRRVGKFRAQDEDHCGRFMNSSFPTERSFTII